MTQRYGGGGWLSNQGEVTGYGLNIRKKTFIFQKPFSEHFVPLGPY